MADKKLVWVKATVRGQLSNRLWVDESSPPFEIEETKVSKRWMKVLTEKQAKKLQRQSDAGAADSSASLSDLAAVSDERDQLAEKVGALEADLKAMTEERDKLKARPAGSVAGAKKD